MNKQILISLSVIGAVAAIAITGTVAYFSDVETSPGNTITAGTLNLRVAKRSDAYIDPLTTALVTLSDMKPSVTQYVYKKLIVDDNPGKVYLHLKDISCTGGKLTEPEAEEQKNAEKCDIDTVTDYNLKIDLNRNGSFNDPGETIIPLGTRSIANVASCWIPLGSLEPWVEYEIEQSFHLRPTVTNWAQGDILTFTEVFMLLQTNDPFDPTVTPPPGSDRVWDPNTRTCVPRP